MQGNGGEHHIWEGQLHGPQQDDPDWKGGKLVRSGRCGGG